MQLNVDAPSAPPSVAPDDDPDELDDDPDDPDELDDEDDPDDDELDASGPELPPPVTPPKSTRALHARGNIADTASRNGARRDRIHGTIACKRITCTMRKACAPWSRRRARNPREEHHVRRARTVQTRRA